MARKLDLKDLLAQQKEIADQIKELQVAERSEFKARVEAEARELGLDCYEIWGGVKRKAAKVSKSTAGAKYVDPANSANVYYLSRGKKPRWLQAYLDEGRQLEEFAA